MAGYEFQIIAAFTGTKENLRGNPAAVILLPDALDDELYAQIASDFNQPATTFLWPSKQTAAYHVRWFAPDQEIDLCGHGSLAALALLKKLHPQGQSFTLLYRNGALTGHCSENSCTLLIDSIPIIAEKPVPALISEALGINLKGYFTTNNKQIVLAASAEEVKSMNPDFQLLRRSPVFGYAVTAADSGTYDFVSRTLVPHVRQLEDFATGSSHAALVPFWSHRLRKSRLTALQASSRGGRFICEMALDKVKLTGFCNTIATGMMNISMR